MRTRVQKEWERWILPSVTPTEGLVKAMTISGRSHQMTGQQASPASWRDHPWCAVAPYSLPTWCSWPGGEINRGLQPENTSRSERTICRTERGQWDIRRDTKGCISKWETLQDRTGSSTNKLQGRKMEKKKKRWGRDLKDTLAKCNMWAVCGSWFKPTETNRPCVRHTGRCEHWLHIG